jgi:Xaa-Pro aminopeptidase
MPKESNILFVSTLDDIAWTLNLRGNDIDYNPLFFSYFILHRDGENAKADLFIQKDKVSAPEVSKYLESINVTVYDYEDLEKVVTGYKDNENKKITISKGDCSAKMH